MPKEDELKVAIVGAGNCGGALAAVLELKGAKVLLCADPDHSDNVDAIKENGYLKATGKIEGRYYPTVTTDMSVTVAFSDIIVITVPSYGHRNILKKLEPFDLRNHIIIIISGNFFTFLALKHHAKLKPRAFIETSTSPSASRMTNGEVLVLETKRVLPIAAMPIDLSEKLRNKVARVLCTPLEWCINLLEVNFLSISAVIHVPAMIFNAGWIVTTKGNLTFYRDGMSRPVVNGVKAVDGGRVKIGTGFNLKMKDALALMNAFYDLYFTDLEVLLREIPSHNSVKATPATLRHRFLTQDVPHGLVPLYEFGLKIGIDDVFIKSLIVSAAVLLGEDDPMYYFKTGRNLREIGFDAASKEQILKRCNVTQADWNHEFAQSLVAVC